MKRMPPAMILCGGLGTRLREVTEILPKPMVPIGEQPIIWHIMKTYAAFGVRRFILCLGYRREQFIDYFMNYHLRTTDATIKLGHAPEIKFYGENSEADWEVTLAGTGLDAQTGCRVSRAVKYLHKDEDDFFLTYGDGVCDLDLNGLIELHKRQKKLATLTVVHPAARFGEMEINGENVLAFQEKPVRTSGYINGGYMMLNRGFVKKYLLPERESLVLEKEPIRKAVADGEVASFRHDSFWQCMDTPREYQYLNDLWRSGAAPWTKYWK